MFIFSFSVDEEDEDLYDTEIQMHKPDRLHSIMVVKTHGGVQEEVAYSDLDRQSQKDVITDLLVKSAVHYALKKQEVIYFSVVVGLYFCTFYRVFFVSLLISSKYFLLEMYLIRVRVCLKNSFDILFICI